MAKLQQLLDTLSSFLSDNAAKLAARVAAITEQNSGKAPTVDANGRLHAPCEGYVQDGDVYAAGEYLPDEGARNGQRAKAKIKIKLSSYKDIKKVWEEVSHGKSWAEGECEVCYAYVEGLTQSQAKHLNAEFSGQATKRLVLAEEAHGLENGAVFKLNARGIAADYKAAVRGSDAAYDLFTQKMQDQGWTMKDKKGKVVFENLMKGKQVCYVYEKPELP